MSCSAVAFCCFAVAVNNTAWLFCVSIWVFLLPFHLLLYVWRNLRVFTKRTEIIYCKVFPRLSYSFKTKYCRSAILQSRKYSANNLYLSAAMIRNVHVYILTHKLCTISHLFAFLSNLLFNRVWSFCG
jgi:hypothetical protein